jgi:hypothetical protein
MRNKYLIVFIVILMSAILLAGCTNTPAISTPVTVTPTDAVAAAMAAANAHNAVESAKFNEAISNVDPIIGKWVYTTPGGIGMAMTFQSDKRILNGVGDGYSGTWTKNSPGVYTETSFGRQYVLTYDSTTDTLTTHDDNPTEVWKRG